MVIRRRVIVTGVVQGVGFRPFAWRRATRLGLDGFVANETAGVVIEIEGPQPDVAAFLDGLAADAPPLARVERVEASELPAASAAAGFAILGSAASAGPAVPLPADVATCAACLAEVGDPGNRRHRHPFATCTDCGPRFTISEAPPYDRAATTMRDFAMCPACAAEYADPADRRFHAETIACPRCGPGLWFTASGPGIVLDRAAAAVRDGAALDAARALLRGGGILALKGIGGFHLACDATDEAAVRRLRERKRRGDKPLAVMAADLDVARGFAVVDPQERILLEGVDRPIVLLRRRRDDGGSPLAAAIAPGNDFVGVVLPYSPLHHLLAAGLPPLVMTSGNRSAEPIAHDDADAAARLGPIGDGFLLHDRRIVAACDDAVVRCVAGAALPIRRSRGQAPLPIPLAAAGPVVLAVGAELKAAPCLAHGTRGVMSPHVGDVATIETLEALGRAADRLVAICGVEPAAVAADLHPGYVSTGWARAFAAELGIPLVQVQHHEAHAAALLAEHGLDVAAGRVVVACFDGTGFGRDGTIQGGEFFTVESGAIRRSAHLEPFPLPGGDAAIRHPWRVALALLHAAGLPWDDRLPPTRAAGSGMLRLLGGQLDGGVGCVATTSMGRMFDAVASLAGVRHSIGYEAEAALNLEALAARGPPSGGTRYEFAVSPAAAGATTVVGWRDVVAAVVEDALAGVPPAVIAEGFHAAIARMIVAVAERLGARGVVGLTGGVFQNALLVERTVAALRAAGQEALLHHRVPPNDGGLALGQAVLARRLLAG